MAYDRDSWELGYTAGFQQGVKMQMVHTGLLPESEIKPVEIPFFGEDWQKPKKKRKGKMSAYNKFVKDNASKPRFKYKSGKMKGRVNMKKIAQAWKKTAAYKRGRK